MSAEEYLHKQTELLKQQYQILSDTDNEINLSTSPLGKANAEREKELIQRNIKHIEWELYGLPKAAREGVFRANSIRLDTFPNELIGRETELSQLDQLLHKDHCAAIIGVGGQGKTALAYTYLVQSSPTGQPDGPKFKSQSSHSLIQNSPTGQPNGPKFKVQNSFDAAVWLYMRGDTRDLDTLAGLLGVERARLPEDTAELVRRHLLGQPTLVVLDNFEDAIKPDGTLPLDVAALLPRLTDGLSGPSRVIITSREVPPKFPARQVLRLGGLAEQAGAEFLLELGLDKEPMAQRQQASRQAGGNPFALTLLAGLVTDSATGDTLEILLRQGDLWDRQIANEERFLPRTWDTRLNDDQRRLLQLLSVLRPPTRYQSLRDLFQPADERDFRELLKQLAAKALLNLEYDPADPKKLRGYDLHPLLRRFILVHKLPDPERATLHQSATAYFQSLIPTTLPPKENYGRKILEHAWCVLEAVHHLNEQGDYEAATDLFFDEALHEDLDRLGQPVLLIEIFSQWAKVTTWRSSSTRGVVLGNLGLAYYSLGRVEEAIVYYQQALAISREIGDRRGEGNHLANLGVAYEKQEQMSRALAYWRRAVEIYREIKAPTAETVQGWIDELHENEGEEEFARRWAESEPLYQELK